MSLERMLMVHKEGEEGVLQVRHSDGKIMTPLDERPDWAEGLVTAMVQERITFYTRRLGEAGSPYASQLEAITGTDTVAFQDLGWIGVNEAQQEVEVEADPEWRSESIAKLLGIDTEAGTMGEGLTAEREIMSRNERRTPEETAALEEGLAQGFGTGEESASQRVRAGSES
jgi:hypothetical protein